ncbi:hypothetical protein POF50_010695 [Streptomyces sp. SL13]|uniref:DUF4232 domain-containing protein n=1 Tax=Streptantibioticus silvisoli TaxID=2705255 RepID=A0AA90GX91_9ACTN|nr:hypothetical protein [Streptantibioticus silvisoli]MDI5962986.1 hypothetical protein [Streptantibioticus silvisoli]MDI5969798.1 hypothetical protein [Streptantibioticus silvisoli]
MTRPPDEPHPAVPNENDTPRDETPRDAARPPRDAGRPAADAFPPAPGGLDELALRRLMHDAVREVEPDPAALDRICQAVPARRARRRQAMVGAAAGVLLVGTAVPAVLHATQPAGSDTAGNVNSSSGLTPGSTPTTHRGTPIPGEVPGPAGRYPGPGATTAPGVVSPSATEPGSIAAPTPGGGGSSLTDTPACSREQLGQGSAVTGTPDADGRVYGTFRVVNVSSHSCTVTGPSEISVTPQGGTDGSQIQVVDHTEGDPASGLPNPAEEPAAVILPPGQAYQVQFAWIPASGGGPTGCAVESSPPPTDTSGGSTGTDGSTSGTPGSNDGGTGSGSTAQATGGDPAYGAAAMTQDDSGGTPSGSPGDGGGTSASPSPPDDGIALSTVPPEGDPVAASTDISGACAGTVYQTDPMPTP